MHRSEARELVECIDCGATIAPDRDRAFAITEDLYLCFDCALRRGGAWDEREDRWMRPPELSGVTDERRPHV
jgi:hypothetical protein